MVAGLSVSLGFTVLGYDELIFYDGVDPSVVSFSDNSFRLKT